MSAPHLAQFHRARCGNPRNSTGLILTGLIVHWERSAHLYCQPCPVPHPFAFFLAKGWETTNNCERMASEWPHRRWPRAPSFPRHHRGKGGKAQHSNSETANLPYTASHARPPPNSALNRLILRRSPIPHPGNQSLADAGIGHDRRLARDRFGGRHSRLGQRDERDGTQDH